MDTMTEEAVDLYDAVAEGDFYYPTRDEIAHVDDYEERDVVLAEWGKGGRAAKVRVKTITGEERDEFESGLLVDTPSGNREVDGRRIRAKLVVLAVVHPPGTERAGEAMFDISDIGWISGKSARALDKVFTVAQQLAGMSDDDVKALEESFGKAPATEPRTD